MLVLENVRKTFVAKKGEPRDILAIERVAFPSHGLYAICGPSGCGKSTLLNIIGLMDGPTSGAVYFNGDNISKLSQRKKDLYRHHHIGYLLQAGELIPHLNVLENVMMPYRLSSPFATKAEEIEKAKSLLARFGMSKRESDSPLTLSGGETSRVALARALAMEPKILLCDEPTGALDHDEAEIILAYLKEISHTSLVIIVSHDEPLMERHADAILRLREGKLTGAPILAEEETQASEPTQLHHRPFSSWGLSGRRFAKTASKKAISALISSFGVLGIALALGVSLGAVNLSKGTTDNMLQRLPLLVSTYHIDSASNLFALGEGEILPPSPYVHGSARLNGSEGSVHVNLLNSSFQTYLSENFAPSEYELQSGVVSSFLRAKKTKSGSTEYSTITGGENNVLGTLLNSFVGETPLFRVWTQEEESLTKNYDCIYGHLPQNENEAYIVVDQTNSISTILLNALGFDEVDVSFADLTATELKFVPDEALYIQSGSSKAVTGKFLKPAAELQAMGKSGIDVLSETLACLNSYQTGDLDALMAHKAKLASLFGEEKTQTLHSYNLIKNSVTLEKIFQDESVGSKLKIAGILRKKPSVIIDSAETGLYYSPQLQAKVAALNGNSPIAKEYHSHVVYQSSRLLLNIPHLYSVIDYVEDETNGDSTDMATVFYNHFRLRQAFGLADGPSAIRFPAKDLATAKRALQIIAAYNEGKDETDKIYCFETGINTITLTQDYSTLVANGAIGIAIVVSIANLLILTLSALLDTKGRIREIGLYRALGASKGYVIGTFLGEASMLGLVISAIGIPLSYGVIAIFNVIIEKSIVQTVVRNIIPLPFPAALAVIGISIGLTLLATLIATLRYSSIHPSQALHQRD